MNKAFYLAIAIIAFTIPIVVMAPASIVAGLFADAVQRNIPGLKIGATRGRIWQGATQLQYQRFPAFTLSWKLAALPLFTGKVSTLIELNGGGLQLEMGALASTSGGSLDNINGTIESRFINAVSVGYGLELTGVFELSGINTSYDQRWLTSLKGVTNWSGGIVHIETPAQFYSVKLPALTGQLSMKDSNAVLDVAAGTSSLLTLALKPDGWSQTSISYMLAEMAGLPLPNGYQDTTGPAFFLEEKVF
ncbi:MAG: type II secretion system protein N [Pseudomonadales bacterium]|nr:type II secretion system protein N [Pseudomonadales bacterium]